MAFGAAFIRMGQTYGHGDTNPLTSQRSSLPTPDRPTARTVKGERDGVTT